MATRTPQEMRRAFRKLNPPLVLKHKHARHGEKWEHPHNGRCIILPAKNEVKPGLLSGMVRELEGMGYSKEEVLKTLRLSS